MKKITEIHSRNPNSFQVEVEQAGKVTAQAIARNISPEGMLLELDSVTQQTKANIQLACRVNDMNWLIDATVIHATSTGLGVKFCQPQPSLMRAATARLPKLTQPIAGHFSLA